LGTVVILDTTFLIDLQREFVRDETGPATTFLERNRSVPLKVSVVTVGEFLEGYDPERVVEGRRLFAGFEMLAGDQAVAMQYAAFSRSLRSQGVRMGDNDIWIAATAMEASEPLVTRDTEHFRRVVGLDVRSY
jgi:predicted nucleic acid-binding protein